MQKKSLTLSGFNIPSFIFLILSAGMLGSSIYLFNHHFELFYPTSLSQGAICNISNFFNCNTTAYDPISSWGGVPISVFGLMVSLFFISGVIFPSKNMEGTNNVISLINAAGCIFLFFYSIFIIGSLCPVCTIYYGFSIAVALVFYLKSSHYHFNLKIIGIYFIIIVAASATTYFYDKSHKKKQLSIAPSILKEFNSYKSLGTPTIDSPFRLLSTTKKFIDAPIQISIFSDFQCPACQSLSLAMEQVVHRYRGQANIQYFFYPLDSACNPNMQGPMHQFACQSSYLAACNKDNFFNVHNIIFEHSENLTLRWIKDFAKQTNVLNCYNSPETKKLIVNLISAGDDFNIRSTPTMIINGIKIEGVIPLNQLYIILDHILKKGK